MPFLQRSDDKRTGRTDDGGIPVTDSPLTDTSPSSASPCHTGWPWRPLAILDGLDRTSVQTSHAMDARIPPHRTPIYQTDGRHGTILRTQAAGDAGVLHPEGFGTYIIMYEEGLDDVGLQSRTTAFMHSPDVFFP